MHLPKFNQNDHTDRQRSAGKKALTILTTLVILSCNPPNRKAIFERLPVQTSATIAPTSRMLTGPVAVEAFYIQQFLGLAHSSDDRADSAAAIIENNRQAYYQLMDAYGFYREVIRPRLIAHSVRIVETVPTDSLLQFRKGNGSSVQVNLKDLKKRSGVILFNGSEDPVYLDQTPSPKTISDSLDLFFRRETN